MRLDQWLVLQNKVRSRSQAEELISRGEVSLFDPKTKSWAILKKASYKVLEHVTEEQIKVESELTSFVARSGIKLKKALEKIKFNVEGLKCLDVGQSTGGFTQVLIENKADLVVGLDVGAGQLSDDLKNNLKIKSFENLDIRLAKKNIDFKLNLPFDFVVIDVSFISLTQVLGSIPELLKPKASVLALVKPQFELSAKDLDRKGLVKGKDKFIEVEAKIKTFVQGMKQFKILDYFQSELLGKEGSLEFFIYLKLI